MVGPCELDRNLRECNVVLDRLLPGDAEARMARMAVKECRVVLERLTEAAVSAAAGGTTASTTAGTTAGTITTDEDEDEDEAPRTTRVWRRVLRNTTKTNAASTTVREQTGMGRLRSSARYPLRQKRLSQQDTVMEVTKRSCWRRGRTRSKKPPSSTSTAVSVRTGELVHCAQTEPTEPGAAGQAEQRAQGDADTCEAPAPTPAPAPPNAPNRRLLCFRVVIEAMVRPSTGASIGFGALFDDDEKAVLQRWLELSEGAAATYLHLLASPGPWVRGTTLAASCPGLREHFAALEKTGFVSSAIDDGELRDVLALLLVDELEQITVSLGVKTGRRTRLALVRALLRLRVSGPQQGCLLQERVRGVLGGCVRVLAGPRELVVRALLSVAAWLPVPRDGNRLRAVRTILLQDCPRLLVPEGLPGGHGPTQSMFHTRQQLLDWQAVVNERVALGKAIAGGKTTEVLTISAEVLVQLRAHLESNNTTTPQSRAIGGALVELLDAASEALAREADVDAAAVTVLRVLLGQHELVQERRAAWAVRLAALLQTRMLDYQGAAELLVCELEDGGHRGSHRCRLEERARTVLRGSKCAVGKGVRGALEDTCARLQALLPDKDRPEFPTVTIRSSACARSAPGMKRVYVSKPRGQAVEYLSVEERAMVHYADEYPRGADDEGETLLSLAVLALWKEVYDAEVSGAWGTPVQDRPLDWGTDSFWVARHLTMEQRLQSMLRRAQDAGEEAGSRALAADLSKAREARHGTPSLVRWDLLQGLDIEELLKCLTVPLFVAICRRFFLDFCSYRQGFPDLLLWNPENGKSLFVEVKGPEDALGPHQVKWLEFLRSHEAQVEIAIVQVRTE